MKLLVSGASSFVGAWFCTRAVARGHQVVGLHWDTPLSITGVQPLKVDLALPEARQELAEQGADAVVHLACKVKGSGDGQRETPAMDLNQRMMDTMLALGLPVVYASSTCVHWTRDSGYAQSRRRDEQALRDSGLPFLIIRPCAPYGPRHPQHRPGHAESFHTLADMVKRLPAVPVIGSGYYLRQPVHVDDLSDAMLTLLEQGLPSQAFDAGGEKPMSFNEIVRTMASHLDKRVMRLPVPKQLLMLAARFTLDFEPALLDTADTDDTADPGPLYRATGLRPRSFEAGVGDLFA